MPAPIMLTTMADVIIQIGGVARLAGMTQADVRTVYAWKRRGWFPVNTELDMRMSLLMDGYDAEPDLWGPPPPHVQPVKKVVHFPARR